MIQVDELQIMMPSNHREDGTELGRQVAERLLAALPENYGNQHIPELRLQLQSTTSNDISLMADRIAEQIIRQIKLASLY
jgi:hypothetical protein